MQTDVLEPEPGLKPEAAIRSMDTRGCIQSPDVHTKRSQTAQQFTISWLSCFLFGVYWTENIHYIAT